MKILFAGMCDMRGPITECGHMLARTFARERHEVVHVSTPVSPLHLLKIGSPNVRRRFGICLGGLRHGQDDLRELVPFALLPSWVPGHSVGRSNAMLATTVPPVRRVLDAAGFGRVDLLLIDQPLLCEIWNHVGCRRIVYLAVDLFPSSMNNPKVAWLERRILTACHGVVSASQPVQDHVRALAGRDIPSMVLENGVEYEHFATPVPRPPEYAMIPAPRAVYLGSLDERFDWDVIVSAARALPHLRFVLIGPAQRVPSRARATSNLHLLGPRDYRVAPRYLQHAAAGLLPLNDHPANRGRSPMKFYEYLAAGLPVVARRTPELARRGTPSVWLYSTADEFRSALQAVLAAPPDPAVARDVARRHSWRDVGARILDFAQSLPE